MIIVNKPTLFLLIFILQFLLTGIIYTEDKKTAGQRPVVALVLSGGGALGISHVGVLKVIEEMGIPIDIIVGTSMGSIVGGLYTAGYSPDEMADILTGLDWKKVFSDHSLSTADNYEKLKMNRFQFQLSFDREGFYSGAGLLNGQNIVLLFEQLTIHTMEIKDFDRFPVRYRAVAADILNGKEVVLKDGSLADAMRASMSIPALFRPYYINGQHLMDGGVVNNMPADVARKMGADIVIAVELDANLINDPAGFKTPLDATGQTVSLLIAENVKRMRALADLIIIPDLTNLGPVDFNLSAEFIKRGYEGAQKVKERLREISDRIKLTRSLVLPEMQKNRSVKSYRAPVISQIKVEGGDKTDEKFAADIFNTGLGAPPDQIWLKTSADKVYASGLYDMVRFDIQKEQEGASSGVVKLLPDVTPDNKLFLGFKYHSSFLRSNPGNMIFMTGLSFEDLTGKNSDLYTEISFVKIQRFYMEYFQPLGDLFFIMPFIRYMNEYDTFDVSEEIEFNILYRSMAGGVWTGMMLGRDAEFKAGYSYETVRSFTFIETYTNYESASMLHAAVSYDSRPMPVFPFQGFYTMLYLQHADPAYGGGAYFWKVSSDTELIIPVSGSFSLGLTLSAGSDLSGLIKNVPPLVTYRQFNLNSPLQFAGFEDWDVYGSHKIAAGIDGYYKILPISPLFGGDLILLMNVSAGNCVQYITNTDAFFPLHWNAAAGLGVRINDTFGLALRLSCADLTNFSLSFDMGSFEFGPEETR